jgi:hypothetical protein
VVFYIVIITREAAGSFLKRNKRRDVQKEGPNESGLSIVGNISKANQTTIKRRV